MRTPVCAIKNRRGSSQIHGAKPDQGLTRRYLVKCNRYYQGTLIQRQLPFFCFFYVGSSRSNCGFNYKGSSSIGHLATPKPIKSLPTATPFFMQQLTGRFLTTSVCLTPRLCIVFTGIFTFALYTVCTVHYLIIRALISMKFKSLGDVTAENEEVPLGCIDITVTVSR